MDALEQIELAITGARLMVTGGYIWEDEHGETWELAPFTEEYVNTADAAENEPDGKTHWGFYDLALSCLYLAGEVEEIGGLQMCADGGKRAMGTLIKPE